MNRPPPPLNYVRSFECSARHLSFTQAAKELGFTQAAISTQVKALEHYVGQPLFHRLPRSLKLTDIGEAYLPTLRQALNQIDNATEAVVFNSKNTTVTIACPMSLAENWMAHVLARFSREHADIEVVVQATVWKKVEAPVADLTISVVRDDETVPEAQRLWDDRIALVCSPEFATNVKSADQIPKMSKIFVLGRQDYWTLVADELGIEHVSHGGGLKTNASNVALELAAAGLGLATCPASLTKIYLQRGLLVEPLDCRPPSPWAYYLKRNIGSRHRAVDLLRNWILEAGRREHDRI